MQLHDEPDFIATIYYLTPEQGGRQSAAHSGYRPQVKFDFTEMQTSGQQKFIGTDRVYPGETADAEIRILSPQFYERCLFPGKEFELREGRKVVATGIIKVVTNPVLLKTD